MKLPDLLATIDAVCITNRRNADVTGITSDSRQVRPGMLFVAVPGTQVDGSLYIDDALQRGAIAIAGENERVLAGAHVGIRLRDARDGLAHLAAAFYGRPSQRMQVVGITGTNGKTTIAFMVRDILRAAGREPGMVGTVAYEIGARAIPAARTTPGPVDLQSMLGQMLAAGCRSVVMEVSSHGLVQKRVNGIEFDVGVFTNLTRDHLDYHGSMESYFEAKSLLFQRLGRTDKQATAVVNLDDPWGERLSAQLAEGTALVTYGAKPGADVRGEQPRMTRTGSVTQIATPWGAGQLELRLRGGFNVSNALAAIGVGGTLGIEPQLMLRTLSQIACIPGRLEEVATGHRFQAFVDYAHTDDALEHVLVTLRPITAGRLLLVCGCGGNRDSSKRPAMGAVAGRLADHTILTSDNPRKEDPATIIEQISRGFDSTGRHEVMADRRAAIQAAVNMAAPGDVILIAGKGHETFQELANRTVPFDDRQVVREACEGRRDGMPAGGTT